MNDSIIQAAGIQKIYDTGGLVLALLPAFLFTA
jgi:hypothetical protein